MPQPRRKGHAWQPIADLLPDLRARRFAELDALLSVFEKRRGELEGASALREFQTRLLRSWSIETGILESLYTITESATLTLLEQGFDAAFLSHGDTDLPPEQLIEILRDHQDAAEGLFEFVRGGRSLATSYVKELHQVFTRHQATCDAVDPQGNWVKVPLLRGDWKLQPNNPGDVKTGEVWHQYCPPEQVASEMDRLVALHSQHDDVHYVVEAAWLHHRFTQIHPFQDGNGRVARALASLVCIRARGFPVVVLGTQKAQYIRALEQADEGDLTPLVEMFERQQREACLKAVSLAHSVAEQQVTVEAVLEDARRRLDAAKYQKDAALDKLASELVAITRRRLEEVATQVKKSLRPMVNATVLPPEPLRKHHKNTIAQMAELLGYEATFVGTREEVELLVTVDGDDSACLVVSFHQVGRSEDGIGSALAFLRAPKLMAGPDSGPRGSALPANVHFVCDEPTTFTAERDQAELRATFSEWLERAITRGLDLWRRTL